MTDKPIKGVIAEWTLANDRIYGTCLYHTTYENGIEKGQPITTSYVVQILPLGGSGLLLCETKNSRYILTGQI